MLRRTLLKIGGVSGAQVTRAAEDIAAAVVRHEIDLMVSIVTHHIRQVGPRNLCLSGGVFMNSRLNHDLQAIPGVTGFYVLPCVGNSGMSLSPAVGASHLKKGPRPEDASMFLGPVPGSNEDVIASIGKSFPRLSHAVPADILAFVVDAICQN
jgi:carbamoyltransferase